MNTTSLFDKSNAITQSLNIRNLKELYRHEKIIIDDPGNIEEKQKHIAQLLLELVCTNNN